MSPHSSLTWQEQAPCICKNKGNVWGFIRRRQLMSHMWCSCTVERVANYNTTTARHCVLCAVTNTHQFCFLLILINFNKTFLNSNLKSSLKAAVKCLNAFNFSLSPHPVTRCPIKHSRKLVNKTKSNFLQDKVLIFKKNTNTFIFEKKKKVKAKDIKTL